MSLAQGNNTPTWPRIKPGSPDPESDALTTRPVRSRSSKMDFTISIHFDMYIFITIFYFHTLNVLKRKDTKTIYLRNSTQIPVHWKLSGLETLGDDFTVAADSGIVEPKSEYALNAYFRAMKPVQTSKKTIRLEVCCLTWRQKMR